MNMKKLVTHYRSSALFRHLTWVLLIKVILLWGLWLCIVKPQKQHPDTESVFRHLVSVSAQTPAKTGGSK
jgi:hypothetical protein